MDRLLADRDATSAGRPRLISAYARYDTLSEDELGVALSEIDERIGSIDQKIRGLEARLLSRSDTAERMARFESSVNLGVAILNNDDPSIVNKWAYRHVRVHIMDNEVYSVEYI